MVGLRPGAKGPPTHAHPTYRTMAPRPAAASSSAAEGTADEGVHTRSGASQAAPRRALHDPSNPIFLTLLARRGGCAKTTTAASLAYAMANRGYNCLLVDMDPQCDLTRFLMQGSLENTHGGDYNAMIAPGVNNNGVAYCRTLYEAMAPLVISQDHPQYVIEPFPIATPAEARISGKLHLIAGHEETVDLEKCIGNVEESVQGSLAQMLAAPHKHLKECAIRNNCSFVIIDTNPFSGSMNGNLFHCSDYFLIPCGADNASKHGIRALTDLIVKQGGWLERQRNNINNIEQRNAFLRNRGLPEINFPRKDPKFLGIVLGNYIAHNLDNNNFVQGVANDRPSLPFYGIMTEMANEAAQAMHRLRTDPILEGRRLTVNSAVFSLPGVNLVEGLLGRVRSFRSVNRMAQHWGIPVPFLHRRHLEYRNEVGALARVANPGYALSFVDFFKHNYDQIAWNILMLIHHDSHRLEAPEDWTERKMGGPGRGNFFLEVVAPDQQFHNAHNQQNAVVDVQIANEELL